MRPLEHAAPRMKNKIGAIIEALNGTRDAHDRLEKELGGGPASFYFEQLNTYIAGLFGFAKFKVDQRVKLANDISCDDKPGWKGSEHFLKRGETAVISDVDYFKTGFRYGVVFDNESWIDTNGIKGRKGAYILVDIKHEYWLAEADLVDRSDLS